MRDVVSLFAALSAFACDLLACDLSSLAILYIFGLHMQPLLGRVTLCDRAHEPADHLNTNRDRDAETRNTSTRQMRRIALMIGRQVVVVTTTAMHGLQRRRLDADHETMPGQSALKYYLR